MKPILLFLSTVIALSIVMGCIEDENEPTDAYSNITNFTAIEHQSFSGKWNIGSEEYIEKNKLLSHSNKKRMSLLLDTPRSLQAEYQVIAENNLFRPLGWRKEVIKETIPVETVVEIPQERPAPTYNLFLTGIAQNGHQWIAILEDETRKEGCFIHRGEKLKDYTVSEILPKHIVLVKENTRVQFPLGESVKYNANEQLLLESIANRSIAPNIGKDDDAQQSLIERMKARRRKELDQE